MLDIFVGCQTLIFLFIRILRILEFSILSLNPKGSCYVMYSIAFVEGVKCKLDHYLQLPNVLWELFAINRNLHLTHW